MTNRAAGGAFSYLGISVSEMLHHTESVYVEGMLNHALSLTVNGYSIAVNCVEWDVKPCST